MLLFTLDWSHIFCFIKHRVLINIYKGRNTHLCTFLDETEETSQCFPADLLVFPSHCVHFYQRFFFSFITKHDGSVFQILYKGTKSCLLKGV